MRACRILSRDEWFGEIDKFVERFDAENDVENLNEFLNAMLQLSLGELNIWKGRFEEVKSLLLDYSELLQHFQTSFQSRGIAVDPLKPYLKRLLDVLDIREIHNQICTILNGHPGFNSQQDLLLEYLESIHPFFLLSNDEFWNECMEKFYRSIQPHELVLGRLIASKAAKKKSSLDILEYLYSYDKLLKLDAIKNDTRSERLHAFGVAKQLLVSITNELEKWELGIGGKITKQTFKNSFITKLFTWSRRSREKVEQMVKWSKILFTDFGEDSVKFGNEVVPLMKKLASLENNAFRIWSEFIVKMIETRDRDYVPQESGNFVELEAKEGKFVVNFGNELLQLVKESKQIASLGFRIPQTIKSAVDESLKLVPYVVRLKQIANFYNTIDQQIIPSQQPLLIDFALEFENIVKRTKLSRGPSLISNIEKALAELRNSSEKLITVNRNLRKYHDLLVNKSLTLLKTDLLRHPNKWKDGLTEMRQIFVDVQVNGSFDNNRIQAWVNHWDNQLYKVLEIKWVEGLQELSKSVNDDNSGQKIFTEYDVDLVVKAGGVQLKPVLEELRSKIYRDFKRFISIPSVFKGTHASISNVRFESLIGKNSHLVVNVYQNLERVLRNVTKNLSQFEAWAAYSSVTDMEATLTLELVEPSHWEHNFRFVKSQAKQLDSIPAVIKCDFINIQTKTFRIQIESLLDQWFDALISSLKTSITGELKEVELFIIQSSAVLAKKPTNVTEIGELSKAFAMIDADKSKFSSYFQRGNEKYQVLRQVTSNSNVPEFSDMVTRWDKFCLVLNGHKLMIEEQTTSLKAGIVEKANQFSIRAENFMTLWEQSKPKSSALYDSDYMAEKLEFLKSHKEQLKRILEDLESIQKQCEFFSIPNPGRSVISIILKETDAADVLWNPYREFTSDFDTFSKDNWIISRNNLNSFRLNFEKWNQAVDLSRKKGDINPVQVFIQKELDIFKSFLDIAKLIKGENWNVDHWQDLFKLAQIPNSTKIVDLKTASLIKATPVLSTAVTVLLSLNERANSEAKISEALQELDTWAAATVFQISNSKFDSGKSITIIKSWTDLMSQISDMTSLAQSLKSSTASKKFTERITFWELRLVELDAIIQMLNTVQRRFLYLYPIFASDSGTALVEEAKNFRDIDEEFTYLMSHIASDPRVVSILTFQNVRKVLEDLVDKLERSQKALSDYLERKRNNFPRFFFIGDDDLLEILGQSKNPSVVQNHLRKLFAGIYKVEFSTDQKSIIAIFSKEGEHVQLENPIVLSSVVEDWLFKLDIEVKKTLVSLLFKCIALMESDIIPLDRFPEQIVSIALYISFTSKMESCIRSSQSKSELRTFYLKKLNAVREMKLENKLNFTLARQSLISLFVTFIDIINECERSSCQSITDWVWVQQLRFYVKEPKQVLIKCVDTELMHTFEYQGNAPRLVHTSLTQKCYLTLTQAVSSGFGGNPFGPAGTGKTETVKMLGSIIGRQVLVFNCDEGIDEKSLGRIFTGVVKCGAWVCFDEFNRLEEVVLSAVASQINSIVTAVKDKNNKVVLNAFPVDLNPNTAVFVTLNPAGKGYGGRQKLPDNLKQLFRSIAMTETDFQTIATILLLSEGFESAEDLGKKMDLCFKTSKNLLSKQRHYDWGLRSLKAVIGIAGRMIKLSGQNPDEVKSQFEESILIDAIKSVTVSKLVNDDLHTFLNLVNDIFPGASEKTRPQEFTKDDVLVAFQKLGIIPTEAQINRVFQLDACIKQRMGVGIIGPPSSGKSTIWKALANILNKDGQNVKLHVLNPKSVARHVLLGRMDIDSREWHDGILTHISRIVVTEDSLHHFIIVDGDIDPEWIEALNSVLDDNRLLTMPSGERIQFGRNVNFIFESINVDYASPATISRMALLYLSNSDFSHSDLLNSWLQGKENSKLPFCKNASSDARFLDYIRTQSMSALHRLLRNVKIDDIETLVRLLNTKEKNGTEETSLSNGIAVYPELRRSCDLLKIFIESGLHVSIHGPQNSGKSALLNLAVTSLTGCSFASYYCHHSTTVAEFLNHIGRFISFASSASGKVVRPLIGRRLIIELKRLDLVSEDKYESSQFASFLHCVCQNGGYFDSDLIWINLENIVFVVTNRKATSSTCRFNECTINLKVSSSTSENLEKIIKPVIDWTFQEVKLGNFLSQKLVYQMVDFCVELFKEAQKLLSGSPIKLTVEHFKSNIKNAFAAQAFMTPDNSLVFITKYIVTDLGRLLDMVEQAKQSLNGSVPRIFKSCFGTNYVNFENSLVLSSSKEWDFVPRDQYLILYESHVNRFKNSCQNDDVFALPQLAEPYFSICEAIHRNDKHIVLLGQIGTGRRSLLDCACLNFGWKMFKIGVPLTDIVRTFQNSIKNIIQNFVVASKEKVVVYVEHSIFAIADLQILFKYMMLKELYGFFSKDEISILTASMKEEHVSKGENVTLFEYARKMIFENTVFVFGLNISSKDFTNSIFFNPILLEGTLITTGNWPRDTYFKIAKKLMEPVKNIDDKAIDMLISRTYDIWKTQDVSPREFIELIQTSRKYCKIKSETLQNQIRFYDEGLKKLLDVAKEADKLKVEARTQSSILGEKQAAADSALNEITARMSESAEKRKLIEHLTVDLRKEEEEINQRKDVVELQLKDVEPLIAAARESVGQLKSENISEIRALRAPPAVVRDVLEAVLRLMGIFDMSWNNMKSFLGKRTIKEEIMSFDARKITSQIRESVQQLLAERSESFEDANVKRSSSAAYPLALWVKANIAYSQVMEKIRPLEDELQTFEDSLKRSQLKIKDMTDTISTINEEVNALRQKFSEKTREVEMLKLNLDKANRDISAADKLLEDLSSEKVRWKIQIEKAQAEFKSLSESALFASLFAQFIAQLPPNQRSQKISSWKSKVEIPYNNVYTSILDEFAVLKLRGENIRPDAAMLDNAAVLELSSNFSLVVDNSGQTINWLKNHFAESNPEIVSIKDPLFMKNVELSVRFGRTLILTDASDIPAVLFPLAKRDFQKDAARWNVQIGEKTLECDAKFRLVFVAFELKLQDELRPFLSVVNCSPSSEGLSEQLLSRVLSFKNPDIEKKLLDLRNQKRSLELKLKDLETSLVEELRKVKGNVLGNETLISALNAVKSQAISADTAIKQVEKTSEEIKEETKQYEVLSAFGSKLFVLIGKVNSINPMYNFGLEEYLIWFDSAVSQPESPDELMKRLSSVILVKCTTAMLKEHRSLFGLILYKEMFAAGPEQPLWEIMFGKVTSKTQLIDVSFNWLPEKSRDFISAACMVSNNLKQKFSNERGEQWKQFKTSSEPESSSLIANMSLPEKLIIFSVLRPDKYQTVLQRFLESKFGNYEARNSFDMLENLEGRPMLYIIPPGSADPSVEIKKMAGKRNVKISEIVLTQSIDRKIWTEVLSTENNGQWILIPNIHIYSKVISKQFSSILKASKSGIKIIMTSEETSSFSISFLQECTKAFLDVSVGIKNTVSRLLSNQLKPNSANPAWFHSLIQERKNFAPQGWTKLWEFSQADFYSLLNLFSVFQINLFFKNF